MKHILLAFLFLVLLAAAVLVSLRMLKPDSDRGVEEAARLFFYQLENNRPYDAFRGTASKLQAASFARFESALAVFGLSEGVGVSLAPALIGSSEATVHGSFEHQGEPRKVTLNLIYQGGRWKVYSILSDQSGDVLKLGRRGDGGMAASKVSGQNTETEAADLKGGDVPSEQAMRELVLSTLMSFNEAVQLRYFALFYQQISQAWQQQTTPSKLTQAFSGFMEKKVSFPEIASIPAEFTEEPYLDGDGLLHIRGYYPHPRYEIRFYVRYTFEHPKWRLFGIDIDLVRAKEKAEPTAEE